MFLRMPLISLLKALLAVVKAAILQIICPIPCELLLPLLVKSVSPIKYVWFCMLLC